MTAAAEETEKLAAAKLDQWIEKTWNG